MAGRAPHSHNMAGQTGILVLAMLLTVAAAAPSPSPAHDGHGAAAAAPGALPHACVAAAAIAPADKQLCGPALQLLNARVASVCAEMPMEGCSECAAASSAGGGGCATVVPVYRRLCSDMPDMGQCAEWHATCSPGDAAAAMAASFCKGYDAGARKFASMAAKSAAAAAGDGGGGGAAAAAAPAAAATAPPPPPAAKSAAAAGCAELLTGGRAGGALALLLALLLVL